jgi:hypothetical protein
LANTESTARKATTYQAVSSQQVWRFSDLILQTRFAEAIESGVARYPIHRFLRFAARVDLQHLFDRVALELGWRAQRLDSRSMFLDGDGLFVVCHGSRKTEYCSCFFDLWAESASVAEAGANAILALAGSSRIVEPMFSIDWHFLTSKGELESASIEEMADDVLLDESYPDLEGGVGAFLNRFLDAKESVLVLQGQPGTGKTRLIRAILGEISRRKGGQAQALYTGDKKTLESDEIFVKFITGWDDAFVVEDADHILKPRASGNEHLHRFLAIADGVVRAQGRKIIFSTNLPNVGDLDEALTRPGRCYARIFARPLSPAESERLLLRLCNGEQGIAGEAMKLLSQQERATHSLAEIYRAADACRIRA